jgi:hypothetical protein
LESAAVLPTILGLAGGTAGSYGGSKLAKKAGASEFEQEVAGDVGGLAGGVLGAESPSIARAVKSGVESGLPLRAAARGTQALVVDPLTDAATAAVKPFVKGYRAVRDINTPVDEILPIELPKPKVPGQDYGIPNVRAAKGTVGRDYVPVPTEPTPAAKPAGNFGRIAYGERTPFEPKAEGLVDNSHVPESNEPIPAAKPGLPRIEYGDPTEYEPEITPEHVKSSPGTSMGDLIPVEMNRVNQALGKVAPAPKPWEAPGVVSDIKTRTTRPGSLVQDENVLPEDRVELPRTMDAQVKERALANRTRANAEVTRLQKAGMGPDEPAMKKAREAKRAAELLYQKSLRKTKLQSDYKDVLLPENRPEPAFGSAYRRR